MGPEDLELLEACRRGSAEARERFVRRFGGLVRWSVQKTLGEKPSVPAEPDDVFQEVFRRLFEPGGLDGVRDPQVFKTWLVVVACRAALDALKRAGRSRQTHVPLDEAEPGQEGWLAADPSTDPAEQMLEREKLRLVEETVNALPPRDRACVRYHYLEGWSLEKIGSIMGLPKGTVATVVRRARQSLRRAFERHGYEG